ncbi:MAG: hypothetical protein Q7S17_09990 [Xanthobacteraceae bacterium]|nr:hypothetical protein [Xanthobacteraceae bacterium]
MNSATGIGDIFERKIKSDGRTISVASLVFVFAQLGPGPFAMPAPRQFIRPNLRQEYPAWNDRLARTSLDRAIKHRAKGWINDKELAVVERICQDAILEDAEVAALRAKEGELYR